MSELALKTVMISKEEYERYLEMKTRIDVLMLYIKSENYAELPTLCRILGREDVAEFLIEREKAERRKLYENKIGIDREF